MIAHIAWVAFKDRWHPIEWDTVEAAESFKTHLEEISSGKIFVDLELYFFKPFMAGDCQI